jgi:hypothetical protein
MEKNGEKYMQRILTMCTIPISHEAQKSIYETNGIQELKTKFQSGKLRGTNNT